jgi:cell division septum initiation protein DivIVA
MSVVEQGSASPSDLEIGVPEFPVALRGYDRQQVDAFVQDLTIRLTAERRRAEQFERHASQMRAEVAHLREAQGPPSFEQLGIEAGRVLAQAGSSAKILIEEAQIRGRELVDAAESRAAATVERAERRAAELEAEATDTVAEAAAERERILAEAAESGAEIRDHAEEEARTALQHAQDAADRMLQRAAAEQTTMRDETERLRESRDRMLDYLGRIHADLGELLSEAVQADAELAAPANGHLALVSAEDDGEDDEEEEGEDGEDLDLDEEMGDDEEEEDDAEGEEGEEPSSFHHGD